MTSRETLLGMAKLYQQRGEPIPLHILVGLSLSLFGLPHNTNLEDEGDDFNVLKEEPDF